MWPWFLAGGVVLGLVSLWRMRSVGSRFAGDETAHALRRFKLRREMLEAKFFDLAAGQGKPRGLRWTRCDWKDEVRFARELQSQLLTAFVAVDIHFEAIPGEEMEELEAVDYFREASAVFHYQNGAWGTGGKALFNMSPEVAVSRLAGQFEPIEAEKVGR